MYFILHLHNNFFSWVRVRKWFIGHVCWICVCYIFSGCIQCIFFRLDHNFMSRNISYFMMLQCDENVHFFWKLPMFFFLVKVRKRWSKKSKFKNFCFCFRYWEKCRFPLKKNKFSDIFKIFPNFWFFFKIFVHFSDFIFFVFSYFIFIYILCFYWISHYSQMIYIIIIDFSLKCHDFNIHSS